jgi:hypothetical protein
MTDPPPATKMMGIISVMTKAIKRFIVVTPSG